jgi:hypothetical protein
MLGRAGVRESHRVKPHRSRRDPRRVDELVVEEALDVDVEGTVETGEANIADILERSL